MLELARNRPAAATGNVQWKRWGFSSRWRDQKACHTGAGGRLMLPVQGDRWVMIRRSRDSWNEDCCCCTGRCDVANWWNRLESRR